MKKLEIAERLKEIEGEVRKFKHKMKAHKEDKLGDIVKEVRDFKEKNSKQNESKQEDIMKTTIESKPKLKSAYGKSSDHLVESLYNIDKYIPDNVKKKPNISSTRFANRFQVAVNMLDDWYVMDDESGKYVDSSSFPQSGDEPYKSIQQSKKLQNIPAKTIDFTGVINDLKAVNPNSIDKRKRKRKKDIN